MIGKIKRVLKANKILYLFYAYLGTVLVNTLKLFTVTDNNLILFVSFGGKKYDDSPKAIFEYIRDTEKYRNYKCVWAFEEPHLFNINGAKKIKIDSFEYYITLLKAKYWVTNTSVKRGLNLKKKKGVFYLNTWHGTPIKKLGNDVKRNSSTFKSIETNADIDVMLVQSNYEAEIFARAFNVPKEKILLSGLPRNDELVKATEDDKIRARRSLGIDINKRVILYAPTFREFDRDKDLNCYIAPPIDVKKWRSVLGNEYVLLIRAHHEVGKILMDLATEDFVLDVSNYPVLNELMIASDILISDYSSIFFDYSLLKKPILCYAYDIEKYREERGLYIDLEKEFPGGVLKTEAQVLEAILNMDYDLAAQQALQFSLKYVDKYGSASKEVTEVMFGF